MIGNKYKYGFIDLSYILMRNVFAAARGKKIGEFGPNDVIKMTIQTLNKMSRDHGISVDKYIFIRDQWSREYQGYYRTHLLRGLYKDTREYITKEKIHEMENDPNVTPEELEEAKLKCYINEVKTESKRIIINGLKDFGVPCIGVEGFEFDDIAYIAAAMLYSIDDKPSVIITKDSDLTYSLTPKMDYFRIPTGGSLPQIITYNEMYDKIPDEIKNRGVNLYYYKAYLDSLGEGHNDMRKTKKDYLDPTNVILQILDGDYSGLADYEVFLKQFDTFRVENFPKFDEVQRIIANDLNKVGKLGSLSEFKDFCNAYEFTGISDRYYSEFINRFDSELYGKN